MRQRGRIFAVIIFEAHVTGHQRIRAHGKRALEGRKVNFPQFLFVRIITRHRQMRIRFYISVTRKMLHSSDHPPLTHSVHQAEAVAFRRFNRVAKRSGSDNGVHRVAVDVQNRRRV